MRHSLTALTLAAALAACSSVPPLPPAAPDRAAATKPPDSAPQRNVTNFSDALRCMDNLYLAYGTRDVSVLLEDLTDATKKVSAGTRDMMMSAISDMTRRSRAIQVIAFGQDANNVVAFLNSAQQRSAFSVVPQFGLRGSITQLDESVLRRQADAGLGLGALASLGASKSRQVNVLGLDVAIVTTSNLALVPGVVSKNATTIIKEGDALDSQATIRKVGINFSTSFQRTDGTAQALRNMVELASVELFGKLLKLPYWGCVGAGPDNAEVKAEIEDWFVGMERAGELTPFFQLQLRNRGYFDGPVDGRVTPALRQAVAAYRRALGLGEQAVVDLELFTRFIASPFPAPPAQPFRDAAVAPLAVPPASGTVAPPVAAAPPSPAQPTPGQQPPAPQAPASPPPTVAAAAPATSSRSVGSAAAPLIPRAAVELEPLKAAYSAGEPFSFRIRSTGPAYVYCYARDGAAPIQRIFPNRWVQDPRVDASKPFVLPGNQPFVLKASPTLSIACLSAPREVYQEVPAALRWGDFQALQAVRGFDEVQRILEAVAKEPVGLATLQVHTTERP
jgi:hypothetical protein